MFKNLALKLALSLVRMGLVGLENRYPGLSGFIDAVIQFLDGGGSSSTLQSHCDQMPGFSASTVKQD